METILGDTGEKETKFPATRVNAKLREAKKTKSP